MDLDKQAEEDAKAEISETKAFWEFDSLVQSRGAGADGEDEDDWVYESYRIEAKDDYEQEQD